MCKRGGLLWKRIFYYNKHVYERETTHSLYHINICIYTFIYLYLCILHILDKSISIYIYIYIYIYISIQFHIRLSNCELTCFFAGLGFMMPSNEYNNAFNNQMR